MCAMGRNEMDELRRMLSNAETQLVAMERELVEERSRRRCADVEALNLRAELAQRELEWECRSSASGVTGGEKMTRTTAGTGRISDPLCAPDPCINKELAELDMGELAGLVSRYDARITHLTALCRDVRRQQYNNAPLAFPDPDSSPQRNARGEPAQQPTGSFLKEDADWSDFCVWLRGRFGARVSPRELQTHLDSFTPHKMRGVGLHRPQADVTFEASDPREAVPTVSPTLGARHQQEPIPPPPVPMAERAAAAATARKERNIPPPPLLRPAAAFQRSMTSSAVLTVAKTAVRSPQRTARRRAVSPIVVQPAPVPRTGFAAATARVHGPAVAMRAGPTAPPQRGHATRRVSPSRRASPTRRVVGVPITVNTVTTTHSGNSSMPQKEKKMTAKDAAKQKQEPKLPEPRSPQEGSRGMAGSGTRGSGGISSIDSVDGATAAELSGCPSESGGRISSSPVPPQLSPCEALRDSESPVRPPRLAGGKPALRPAPILIPSPEVDAEPPCGAY